jgi:hypothetical protein
MMSRKARAGMSLLSIIGGCVAGCAALNPRPPIEEFANKLADQAIIPAVRQGLAQGVEQLTIQAGAQGINPTYVVNFAGKWVVGIEGRASVGVEGIAGQLQVTSAGGGETEPIPFWQNAPPESQPANRDEQVPPTAPGEAHP